MLKDLLFPKTCFSCNRLGVFVCYDCMKKLEYINVTICTYCERPSYLGFTHPHCLPQDGIDGVLSIYSYNRVLKKIITYIKYKGVRDAFREFFLSVRPSYMDRFFQFRRLHKNCFLQPLPLHEKKFRLRGFNQADHIANFFSSFIGFQSIHMVERIKETVPQARMHGRKARFLNVRNAFVFKKVEFFPTVPLILVDDIITTGYTAGECVRVLKKAGAQKVFIFTIARG